MSISRCYKILNLPAESSENIIKSRTKELLKIYHPDKHIRHMKWAETQTKRILEASKILIDETKKNKFTNDSIKIIINKKKKSFLEIFFNDVKNENLSMLVDVNLIDKIIHAKDLQGNNLDKLNYKGRRIYLFDQYLFDFGEKNDHQYVLLYKTKYIDCYMGFRFLNPGTTKELIYKDLKEYYSVDIAKSGSLRCNNNTYIMMANEFNRILRNIVKGV